MSLCKDFIMLNNWHFELIYVYVSVITYFFLVYTRLRMTMIGSGLDKTHVSIIVGLISVTFAGYVGNILIL